MIHRSLLTVRFVCALLLILGCRPRDAAESPPPSAGGPWFVEVTDRVGVNHVHHAFGAENYFFPAIMGPGVALIDYDQDGNLDVFATSDCPLTELASSSPRGTDPSATTSEKFVPSGEQKSSLKLYRQAAPWKFEDVTERVGLSAAMYAMGAAVGDVNNDGWPDLYVTSFGGDRLFLNDQGQRFLDATHSAGIDNRRWSVSAAFVDFDRDGWLDLFVANYVDYDPTHPCFIANGSQDFCNPAMFERTASKLYRNRGTSAGSKPGAPPVSDTAEPGADQVDRPGKPTVEFEDVSLSSGIALQPGAGLGVVCSDFNRDGWPDIYVANDGHANFLWLNQKDGTFRDEAILWNAAYDALGRGQGSMGVAVDDVNEDARPDIFVTNLDGESNACYRSLAEGGFEESSGAMNLAAVSFPRTGFGTAWMDIELDGDLDLAIVNGRVRRAITAPPRSAVREKIVVDASFWSDYAEPNLIHLREGDRFVTASQETDGFLSGVNVARALACGDLDNDGDLDLIGTQSGSRLRWWRNDAERQGKWLRLRLIDPQLGNRDVYGARAIVLAEGKRFLRYVSPGASYLASHDPRPHFGLGMITRIDSVEVLWPDGRLETFPGPTLDSEVTLQRGTGASP